MVVVDRFDGLSACSSVHHVSQQQYKRKENNMERGELTGHQEIKRFILSGNAVFTIQNENTGGRFTYKVSRKKNKEGMFEDVWFVNLLSGSDNTSDYRLIGIIDENGFRKIKKVNDTSTSYQAFKWLWNNLAVLDQTPVKFYHEGRCGRCGRRLTVPESIESGYGPECINKIMGG